MGRGVNKKSEKKLKKLSKKKKQNGFFKKSADFYPDVRGVKEVVFKFLFAAERA